MNKKIIIIGGGISGLSLLHYLRQRYSDRSDIQIRLIERNPEIGGTIKTIHRNGLIFETGPNGFLDSKQSIRNLIEELNLNNDVISANPDSQKRFIAIDHQLHAFPSDFQSFLSFKPLSIRQKVRILGEVVVAPGGHPDETVYDFGSRRFGEGCAKIFFDPMVNGIYAGDIHQLNLRLAFPSLNELEQKHGSLIKGLLLKKKPDTHHKKSSSMINGELKSLKNGMSQLIQTIHGRYWEYIQTKESVSNIIAHDQRFIVETNLQSYAADEIFLTVPAYSAAQITKNLNRNLSTQLEQIYYAPIAVAGLVYKKSDLKLKPSGFGYLVPSWQSKEILGVVFESLIFPNRTEQDYVLLRVMIGGVCHPEILKKSEPELIAIAQEEIQLIFGTLNNPIDQLIKVWPKAIPQYDSTYLSAFRVIQKEMNRLKNIYIAANYWGGVSLNDCIANAKNTSLQSKL